MGDRGLVLLLGVGLIAVVMASLSVGETVYSPAQLLHGLLGDDGAAVETVVREIRLPRVLLGLLVGASLGLCGAALQGLLHNPLAEPGIIGVSGCAALGAVLVFYGGLATLSSLALPLGGIAGALLGVALLYLLAGWRGSTLSMILAGVAINAFAGAMTALVLNLSSSPFAFLEIIFWQMGSLSDRSMNHLWLAGPPMLVGMLLVVSRGRALSVLTLGEATAVSLGVQLRHLRALVIGGTALAVGSAVAVTGVIGFVGLVVPHLLRPLVGFDPRRLLPASALGGALLLLLADIAVRLIPTGNELKLGVITALIGAPFFIYLVYHLRREIE